MAALSSPAPQLTCDNLLQLQPSLQAYLDCFRPQFPRRDQAASFAAYAQGLLSGEKRKSVERMVLRQLDGDMNQVRRLQYFAAAGQGGELPGGGVRGLRRGGRRDPGPPAAVPDRGLGRGRSLCGAAAAVPGDSRGPEQADFAIRRVVASRGSLPGPDV